MAYWLLCQSCKEWSKFSTPLSNDKVCPCCSNSFTAVKSHLSSIPYEISVETTQALAESPLPKEDSLLPGAGEKESLTAGPPEEKPATANTLEPEEESSLEAKAEAEENVVKEAILEIKEEASEEENSAAEEIGEVSEAEVSTDEESEIEDGVETSDDSAISQDQAPIIKISENREDFISEASDFEEETENESEELQEDGQETRKGIGPSERPSMLRSKKKRTRHL